MQSENRAEQQSPLQLAQQYFEIAFNIRLSRIDSAENSDLIKGYVATKNSSFFMRLFARNPETKLLENDFSVIMAQCKKYVLEAESIEELEVRTNVVKDIFRVMIDHVTKLEAQLNATRVEDSDHGTLSSSNIVKGIAFTVIELGALMGLFANYLCKSEDDDYWVRGCSLLGLALLSAYSAINKFTVLERSVATLNELRNNDRQLYVNAKKAVWFRDNTNNRNINIVDEVSANGDAFLTRMRHIYRKVRNNLSATIHNINNAQKMIGGIQQEKMAEGSTFVPIADDVSSHSSSSSSYIGMSSTTPLMSSSSSVV